ncbi:elongation factor Ts [Candidatus Saccharibacteria bacterium]|nr:elongation factor Ts [Candidatus Saccharibacteria bacterium]MCB9834876.1 elongation factor Ts [Candidatus Nomurabacteria bacterium]
MSINLADIKRIREETGAGMMDVKSALTDANGDITKAKELLQQRGIAKASKKSDRNTDQGLIETYNHLGKVGVLLELNCETDFVARTDDFKALAKEIAMQIAASDPQYLSDQDIDKQTLAEWKSEVSDQVDTTKPQEIQDKIIEGKLDKYRDELVLMRIKTLKDPDKSISDLIKANIAKLGENITIKRFVRYQLG